MQFTQDAVTVGVLVHQHEQAAEVGTAQPAAFAGHAVHRDEVPWPDEDFGLDACVAQDRPHLVGRLGERVVRPGGVADDQLPGVRVLLGVQDREDQVLEFGLEGLDTEPFGERDEDVSGDLGDAGLFLGTHHTEGAHVVQSVREFDRHHADVVAGGDEHLTEGLGLGGGAVVDLLQLGHAVDEEADLLAELLADLIERHIGVLDGVVEQRRRQGGGLGAEFGEDQGHRERMRDVRLAALAHLAPVRGLGQDVGAAQEFEVGVGMMGAMHLGHMADGIRQPVTGGGAEQCGPAESAQVDPGPGLPAGRRGQGRIRCGRTRCHHRARGRRVRGLCTHGHLRLWTGGRVPQS